MWGVQPAGAEPVTLEIRLKLTDLENRPLGGVPGRWRLDLAFRKLPPPVRR